MDTQERYIVFELLQFSVVQFQIATHWYFSFDRLFRPNLCQVVHRSYQYLLGQCLPFHFHQLLFDIQDRHHHRQGDHRRHELVWRNWDLYEVFFIPLILAWISIKLALISRGGSKLHISNKKSEIIPRYLSMFDCHVLEY